MGGQDDTSRSRSRDSRNNNNCHTTPSINELDSKSDNEDGPSLRGDKNRSRHDDTSRSRSRDSLNSNNCHTRPSINKLDSESEGEDGKNPGGGPAVGNVMNKGESRFKRTMADVMLSTLVSGDSISC